jgi:F0F1-type ATP synthase membrane subunit b/b'
MSGNDYGNLGNEMKAMKDDRKNLVVETKVQDEKRKAETRKFMADTNAANAELKAETHQLLADADKMMGGIRKDVAGLKAEAGRIITDANGFLSQTSSDNAKLRAQTHKMLAHAHAETKAQARQVMVETKAAVAGILADATDVMKRLCTSSRQRAAGWRDVLRTVRGNGRGAPAGASVAAAVMERPASTKPKGKKKASAKNN